MSDRPWLKLWKKDYLGDIELRLCDPAARGLLVDYMCIADDGQPRGYITRADGSTFTEQELAEICCKGSLKDYQRLHQVLVDRHRIILDEKIKRFYIPRVVKDAAKSAQAVRSGSKGGNPNLRLRRGRRIASRPDRKGLRDTALAEALEEAWPKFKKGAKPAIRRLLSKWMDQYGEDFVNDVMALLRQRKQHKKN